MRFRYTLMCALIGLGLAARGAQNSPAEAPTTPTPGIGTSAATGKLLRDSVGLYPRATQLAYNGASDGHILASVVTFENGNGLGAIYESTDEGQSFTQVGTVADPNAAGAKAYATFALTLLLAPRVDYAVLLGIGLAVVAHLYREAKLGVRAHRDGDTVSLVLSGVLWFGSAHQLEAAFEQLLDTHQGVSSVVIDASALGRVNLSGSLLLAELIDRAEERGLVAEVKGLEPHMQRVLGRV